MSRPQVVRGSVGGIGPGYDSTDTGEGTPSKTADLGFTSQLAERGTNGRSRNRSGSSSSAGGLVGSSGCKLAAVCLQTVGCACCSHLIVCAAEYRRHLPDSTWCWLSYAGCRAHPQPQPGHGPPPGLGVSRLAGRHLNCPPPLSAGHPHGHTPTGHASAQRWLAAFSTWWVLVQAVLFGALCPPSPATQLRSKGWVAKLYHHSAMLVPAPHTGPTLAACGLKP